ncbi:hypothetical protein [Geobacter sp. DSM 9736]|uniref:hypothetical protein n=1 Tax=Geobacter sp. DSM 9736 TaxID=1277350 RepID=UPI0012FE5369|nr:hypothetical protein [Geobacter sp. DSM 9736]
MTDLIAQAKNIIAKMGPREIFTLFGLLFMLLLFIGSRSSGWHKLAKQYPNRTGSHAEWISMPDFFDRPGKGGMVVDFSNCETNAINLGVDYEGMYLSMSIPFRFFHPPIFVPWSDIRGVAQGAPWSKKKHEIRFTFAMSPNVPLDVDMSVAREIEKRALGRWTIPEDDYVTSPFSP